MQMHHPTQETAMTIQPYLFFDGRCDEALGFYQKALGAKVEMLMRFKDSPDQSACPGGAANAEKVMHASVRIGDAQIMASDGMAKGQPNFQGFGLSLTAKNEAEADRFFNALADGGK